MSTALRFPALIAHFIRHDRVLNTYFSERHFADDSISRMGQSLPACPESIAALKAQWADIAPPTVWLLRELPAHVTANHKLGVLS